MTQHQSTGTSSEEDRAAQKSREILPCECLGPGLILECDPPYTCFSCYKRKEVAAALRAEYIAGLEAAQKDITRRLGNLNDFGGESVRLVESELRHLSRFIDGLIDAKKALTPNREAE